MKIRKVLLSAYACEPNKGSEPGVGWRWALELAGLGHDVWVLTRANNRPPIEAELAKMPHTANLHFLYYDLPAWARWWKKGRRGVHLYYALWQWGAYRLAREAHAREQFDLVHHITFGVVRQPSFMGNLGIPFVIGPVGGGEKAPWRLRIGYGWRGWVLDAVRDVMNLAAKFDPLLRHSFRQATYIYVKTPETGSLIPSKFQSKVKCALEIGIDLPRPERVETEKNGDTFRVLYVGRLIYWKGMHLGLRAFAKLVRSCPNASLTIIGDGPDRPRWRKLAERLGVSENINWTPWLARDQVFKLYARHDVLLFPSLHDSSGNVVLEAMAHGLPVICLDLGGPGVMVDETCGLVVETAGVPQSGVVDSLAKALHVLAQDAVLRSRLSAGALKRTKEYGWTNQIRRIYRDLDLPSQNCLSPTVQSRDEFD